MSIRNEIVKRILQVIDPEKILLFGSRASGSNRPNSDYDLLVVASSKIPRWKRPAPIYEALAGMGISKDIVWWTPEEIKYWKSIKHHFITTIIRDGKILYEKKKK